MMTSCDVVIVGAGPAGLMCAYQAAKRGLKAVVIEKNKVAAKKLRITGKGRCNLINACDTAEFLQNIRRNSNFLYSSISKFSPDDICEFFSNLGLELVVERGNRVFPKSGDANDVAEVLISAVKGMGARIVTDTVADICQSDGKISSVILESGRIFHCRAAVIATGGVSYPKTGSTGDGYRFAERLNHSVVPPKASLVPIICNNDESSMQGLSLKNISLIAKKEQKILFKQQGELLFTHFGISGPLVLSLSSFLVDEHLNEIEAYIDLKPALDFTTLDARILRDFVKYINKDFTNSLSELLPKKLIAIVVARSGIDPHRKVNSITQDERRTLVNILKHFTLSLESFSSIDEAIVTAGGVDVREIDPSTMMSKYVQNLHFAGEVLDVDGYTGGFNLGIAFSTGAAAGLNILRK